MHDESQLAEQFMTYFCKLRKATVCIVASLTVANVIPALARVNCNEIFLVKPPGQLAGSIYLNSIPTKDPMDDHLSHPRQGYLPIGTLLVEEPKNASDLLPDYKGFIAANGAQGLVKREHIKQLGELLAEGGGVIKCASIKWSVIPVSPIDDVQVYHEPTEVTDRPPNAFTFSRSAFRLVIISSDELKIKPFGPDKDLFYPIQYAENIGSQESPKWRLNNGLLKREDRRDPRSSKLNGTYRLIRMDRGNFNPLKLIQKDSRAEILKLLFSKYKSISEPQHNPPTMKDCGKEELIRLTGSISGGLNIDSLATFGIGASLINETTIQFPSHEKYILKSYYEVLVDPDQEVKVLKTIHCNDSTMHYTKKIRIILEPNVILAQEDVLKVLGNAFTTPSVSGIEDKPRDRMFVVPYDQQTDIFTPFARLEQFLVMHTNNIGDSKIPEQQRLIALLFREMGLWER